MVESMESGVLPGAQLVTCAPFSALLGRATAQMASEIKPGYSKPTRASGRGRLVQVSTLCEVM